ncbi:MAG: DUF4391 domain-containing protein [Verrucomicrobiales bacterium]|nr:DUF4391 domain-containing protein [Verrucomicrobiales bacterium]
MVEIPSSYLIGSQGKQLNKKNFIPGDATTSDKRRLRECLGKVVLTHQIAGEDIPSRIDEHYHCAVILFLDIQLTDLKHKDFAAKLVQPLMKPFAVLHFHDGAGNHALSFSHKRLNKLDPGNIVVEQAYCTDAFTTPPSTLAFPALINRNSKRDLYLEAMTKAYLIDHPKLFMGAEQLLHSKLWYQASKVIDLFDSLKTLQSLKQQKQKARTQAEKASLNSQLKIALQQTKSLHS